ncbi:MAG: LruC domain-containing protein [Candidatus Cloacimonetes bacterium]|nr:LruC domain-containing protein [Candidatus Cloacimonadota bacterium]
MKKTLLILMSILIALFILLSTGCMSDDDVPNIDKISELEVPEDFEWNNIRSVTVNVTVVGLPASREHCRVELLDGSGNQVSAGLVNDGEIVLKGRVSNLAGDLQVYIPSYNLKKRLEGYLSEYSVVLQVSNIASKTIMNLFGNPGFEDGDMISAPIFYHPPIDGNWYYNQQNSSQNFFYYTEADNTYLSFPKRGYLYQAVAANGGSDATFSFDINNYTNGYVVYQIHLTSYSENGAMTGDSYLTLNTYWDGIDDNWWNVSWDLTIPDNTVEAVLSIYSNSYSTRCLFDNFGFYTDGGVVDSDLDGVPDDEDDYPNDDTKAIKEIYPATGSLIVAFEDLWPNLGDYDFNDMVLGIVQEFGLNANNEYVYLKTEVEVRGNGANLNNVLAMQLDWAETNGTTTTYTPIGDAAILQLLPSTSNVSLDNNIVTIINGVETELTPYYQNNGVGISANYQSFVFEVIFNPISSPTAVISPDFFIYDFVNRDKEIHLPGRPATAFANVNFFGAGDDDSDPANGIWYQTDTNLPWGFEIIDHTSAYKHPLESVSILNAYRYFGNWANSGGLSYLDWFLQPDNSLVYNPAY